MRALLAILLLAACSPVGRDGPDAGGADAGTLDAGPLANGPLPFPLARMGQDDDPLAGTTHTVEFQGTVDVHGPAQTHPFGDEITPARQLKVRLGDGARKTLFYTLPRPFNFAAFPPDALRVLYRERTGDSGLASYAALVRTTSDGLIILFEDGLVGPALDVGERLGFDFALDEGQPLESEEETCGTRVHYPVVVTNGSRSRRLFPGEAGRWTLESGDVEFTLLDAYRLSDSLCGAAPAFSIAYLVKPAAP